MPTGIRDCLNIKDVPFNVPFNSLHEQIRQLAKQEGISINQFLASAAAEKMSALLTEEYIETRAKRASLKKFRDVLEKVPDAEPEEYDRL